MNASHEINSKLWLVRQEVPRANVLLVPIDQPTNHVLLIDCSGSMSSDLPKMREQLKRKMPKLLKEKDTLSIVWFSGRGQCGVLVEGEPVATLVDLKDVEAAIDRWLKPMGLTGFKEPLELVPALVERVSKKNPGSVFSLFFMSDGCDNQWGRPEIIKAAERAGAVVASSTFVEYGYYADRALLAQMAEKCGGTLIFAQDFDSYAPSFEAVIQKRPTGAKRVEVKVEGDPVGGFVYSCADLELVTYAVEGGKVKVPEDLSDFFYLSPSKVGKDETVGSALPAVYAAMSLYAQRMQSSVVYELLRVIGDVRFVDMFSGCFGKQKYSEFMEEAKKAAFDSSLQFTQGTDRNRIPKDDAFTVLDLLRVLAGDEENRVLLDSKDFKYSRIGRGRIDSSEVMTAEEREEVQKLTEEMGKTRDAKKIKELSDKIAALTASKQKALEFKADKREDGYPINSLVYNEERPNVSFNVRRRGTVDLISRMGAASEVLNTTSGETIPSVFPTFIYRNYTVIKDGLVNLDKLPVRLTAGTIRELKKAGMPADAILGVGDEPAEKARARATKASFGRTVEVVFDVKSLPIINRNMVKSVSAKELFYLEYELIKARSSQKVYNTLKKEKFPRKAEGFVELYGADPAVWLKDQGITDYGGFNPKTVQAESTDFYVSKELHVSLKGFSSIPSVKDVDAKIAAGAKLTPAGALLVPALKELALFQAKIALDDQKTELLEQWLDERQKEAVKRVRELLFKRSQITFAIIVGQVWPSEFASLDQNTLTIEVDGQKIEGKLEMREVEVKL